MAGLTLQVVDGLGAAFVYLTGDEERNEMQPQHIWYLCSFQGFAINYSNKEYKEKKHGNVMV